MTNKKHEEGRAAKQIEELPSDTFLWTSLSLMGTSIALKALKKDHLALFIGQ